MLLNKILLQIQNDVASILQPFFSPDGLVVKCLEFAMKQEHIMDFTRLRALSSLFSMMNQGVRYEIINNLLFKFVFRLYRFRK